MPRRKVPYEACPECCCRVDRRWHTRQICRRYIRITQLLTNGYRLADIARRVGLTRERIRQIAARLDLMAWQARHPCTSTKLTPPDTLYQIDKVTVEAQRQGLDVRPFHISKRGHVKQVLIGGRPCQIVTARVIRTNPKYSHRPYVRVYRPRGDWPQFFVYVVHARTVKEEPYFLIIPKKQVRKDTVLLGGEGTLAQYVNAWHLLVGQPQRLRKLPSLRAPIEQVEREAARRGLLVIRPRPATKGKDFYARRLVIEGRRCEVRRTYLKHSCVHLNPPKGKWAEFFVYVVKKGKVFRFLVIPKGVLSREVFRSLRKAPLAQYVGAWHLLSRTSSLPVADLKP